MGAVYLVYEDDYGGLFSPWFLTRVFMTKEEALKYCEERKQLSTFREHAYCGPEPSNYPPTIGSLFHD